MLSSLLGGPSRPKTEKEKREELQALYIEFLERGGGDAAGDWSELEAGGMAISRKKGNKVEDVKPKPAYWANYDLGISFKPFLFSKKEYEAAVKIRDAIRACLARLKAFKNVHADDDAVMQREAIKIQKCFRSHAARALRDELKVVRFKEEEAWKQYDDFRKRLTNEGESVLRWRHATNSSVKSLMKIDKSRRYILLFNKETWGRARPKRYLVQDVYDVKTGYSSNFLRDLKSQKNPERHLSLLVRDSKRSGKETSIDIIFETPDANGDDGKARRDKFYANARRLLEEIEGEGAFFFAAFGEYGRVSRSIFDRWERITLLDPAWVGNADDDDYLAPALLREEKTKKKPPRGARELQFEPWPLRPDDKPQNADDDSALLYRVGDDGARWWSETIEINYRQFIDDFVDDRGRRHDRSKRFKEKFYLQHVVNKTPKTLGDTTPEERQKLRRESGVDVASQPVLAPLDFLKIHFAERVKLKYGELGISGWRNIETKEFEFDAENWHKIEDFALSLRRAKPNAAKTAAQLRKIQEEDDDADERLFKKVGFEKKPAKIVRFRRELLRELWPDQSKMYKKADVSFNLSQKMTFEDEKRRLAKEAMDRKSLVAAADDGDAPPLLVVEEEKIDKGLFDDRVTAENVGEEDEDVFDEIMVRLHPFRMRSSKKLLDKYENRKMRYAGENDHGIRFNITILEKHDKRTAANPKEEPVGLRVVLKQTPLVYGKQTYDASLVIVGTTYEALPSVEIAYCEGQIRDGDCVVAVNKIFPSKPEILVALMADATHKRKLTLVRLHENPDVDFVHDQILKDNIVDA